MARESRRADPLEEIPGHSSTIRLIEKTREGDEAAFAALFNRCRRRLAVLIHYRMGLELRSFLEVEDILQETWLRAFQHVDAFAYRGPGSFMRWLAVIAQHVIVDEAKQRGRQKRRAPAMVGLRSESNPHGPDPMDSRSPSRLMARAEDERRIFRQLDALPADYKEVILLAKIEGLPSAEIAERLGRTREATALLLHRALKRFRQIRQDGEPS
jgi:RNA polymerase sigma-70 factor (ECF subfamily)